MPFAVGEFVFPRIINSMFFCQGTIISQSEKQFQGKEHRGAMFLIFCLQKQKNFLRRRIYCPRRLVGNGWSLSNVCKFPLREIIS